MQRKHRYLSFSLVHSFSFCSVSFRFDYCWAVMLLLKSIEPINNDDVRVRAQTHINRDTHSFVKREKRSRTTTSVHRYDSMSESARRPRDWIQKSKTHLPLQWLCDNNMKKKNKNNNNHHNNQNCLFSLCREHTHNLVCAIIVAVVLG